MGFAYLSVALTRIPVYIFRKEKKLIIFQYLRLVWLVRREPAVFEDGLPDMCRFVVGPSGWTWLLPSKLFESVYLRINPIE